MDKNLVKSSCLVQGVAGDGEEDVEESVVPAQRQQHEVETVNTPAMLPSSLRVYRSVHHLSQGDIALHCIVLYFIHFIHQFIHCVTFYTPGETLYYIFCIYQITLFYILYTRFYIV